MTERKRTQAERRDATIARLIDATIDVLVDIGYGSTSISKICAIAGLSQGALFRQFDSRLDLIARATEAIGERHLQRFATSFAHLDDRSAAALVEVIRDVCRSRNHAAWHEVMVAARTDPALHAVVVGVLTSFEASIMQLVGSFTDVPAERETRVATIILSIMHMFDSEAVTVRVKPNPEIERARVMWATQILAAELDESAAHGANLR